MMPRAPVITRTLTITHATCLCLEPATGNTFEKVFDMLGTYKDERTLLKSIKKTKDSEDMVVVLLLSTETGRYQCLMTEDEFVRNARKMKIE